MSSIRNQEHGILNVINVHVINEHVKNEHVINGVKLGETRQILASWFLYWGKQKCLESAVLYSDKLHRVNRLFIMLSDDFLS